MFKKIWLGLRNVNRAYVSPIDQAIQQFDKTHALSLSQQAEKNRCESIFLLRDHAQKMKKVESKLPTDF